MKPLCLAIILVVQVSLLQLAYAKPAEQSNAAKSITPKQAQEDEIDSRSEAIKEIVTKSREEKKAIVTGDQTEGTEDANPFLKVMKGLAIIIASFLILVHFYKRFYLNKEQDLTRRIQIIERTPLSAKSALVLAQVDGRKVLIGVGEVSISPLETADLDADFKSLAEDKSFSESTC